MLLVLKEAHLMVTGITRCQLMGTVAMIILKSLPGLFSGDNWWRFDLACVNQ